MDKMINSRNLKDNIPTEDKQKLRIAALLHDIGHYPLSHVTEAVMTDNNTKKERKHERLGEHIVKNSSVSGILEGFDFEPAEIAQIITGESTEPLFNQLMSSDLDADRIDYLMRDSIHTGVTYGRFDIDRLIHTLALDKNEELSIEEKGLHSAEGYIIGRHLMYAAVYTHKTINAFNEMVEHICERCRVSAFPSFEQLKKMIQEDEVSFARLNDNFLFDKVLHPKLDDHPYANEIRDMLQRRKALTIAKEALEFSEEERGEREYFLLDEFRKKEKIKHLAEASSVPEEWIFHNSTRTQFPSLKPLTRWSLQSNDEEEEHTQREMSKAIRIVDKNGNSTPLVENKKSVVHYLNNMSLDKVRVYTKEEYVEQLAKILTEELSP